jgi:thymidine phosphorylase
MVGGGYKGYVTYTPFPFDRDYFVPDHSSAVAAPIVAAINDSAANTDGQTRGDGNGDAVKCSNAPPVSTTLEEATIGSEVPTDSSHSTTGTMDTTGTADSVDTITAAPSSLTFRSASSSATSSGSAPVPKVGKVTPPPPREREEMDFNIISLRTSGY